MSVLVTGIGFVGGYIVRDLVAAGNKVVLYGLFGGTADDAPDKLPDLANAKYLVGEENWDNVHVVVGDIRDAELIDTTFEKYDVQKVVHLASLISSSSEVSIPRAIDINVGGSVNIFEAALRHGVERVVWSSSINVFGPKSMLPDGTVSDASPIDPQTTYGSTKAFVERLATRYHVNSGLSVIGLRLGKVYGFGEHVKAGRGGGNAWFSHLAERPAMGLGPNVVPFAEQSMGFQYTEDISAAFLHALNATEGIGQSFLTPGDYRSISDAFDYVRTLLPNADMKLVEGSESAGMQAGGQINWARRFDASAIREVVGFKESFGMEEGLHRMISEYRRFTQLPPVKDYTSTI